MGFTFTWTPGKQFAPGEKVDNDKLNLLGQGTATITGTLADLANVDPAAAANGQPLVYDTGISKWKPGIVAAAYLTTMVACTPSAAGVKGAAPAPAAGDQDKYLAGSAEWKTLPVSAGEDGARLFLATKFV